MSGGRGVSELPFRANGLHLSFEADVLVLWSNTDPKALGLGFNFSASLLGAKGLAHGIVGAAKGLLVLGGKAKGLLVLGGAEKGLGLGAVESAEKNFEGAGVDVGVVDSVDRPRMYLGFS